MQKHFNRDINDRNQLRTPTSHCVPVPQCRTSHMTLYHMLSASDLWNTQQIRSKNESKAAGVARMPSISPGTLNIPTCNPSMAPTFTVLHRTLTSTLVLGVPPYNFSYVRNWKKKINRKICVSPCHDGITSPLKRPKLTCRFSGLGLFLCNTWSPESRKCMQCCDIRSLSRYYVALDWRPHQGRDKFTVTQC